MKDQTRRDDLTPPAVTATPADHHYGDAAYIPATHKELLASVIAEAARATRAKALERLKGLQARLAVAKEALELRSAKVEQRLLGLHSAMESARVKWQRACAAYEAERLRGQSECAPLQHAVYDIIAEINRPDLACRGHVKQWDHGEHVPRPKPPVA
jgi:hypothetical protein